MMNILVNNGNSFNQTDYNHRTPLWHAAKNNHYQVCEILLHKIANPFIESKCGKKPLDITTDQNIRKLLNEYMEVFY
jgi:ankyrin repeat protein